ncbi:hypothetical protein J2S40_003230 [Nocardioides luteus]|uniref:Uncharacterized protein n=1 Tax=Nocardioides luteus TaxID=1844 RepID=A0ABQ5SXN0_9ACTN|nr:hypothetical protein [Nocardioides luteus]MDR7312172.1 hypothetical protein [Nocardioides luteus]GGR56471.1 hypothetical protein GCM10010197_23970 [Nocardioides luteus]GLJ68418.1 hypothetical protein GCM10017579_24540 [Nocardioides luteus]
MTMPDQTGQPAPGQPPVGWIDLTIQGSHMTSNMIVPTVLLNGHKMPTQYGRNVFPVPPGHWTVEMYAQWTWKFGKASLTCDVAEGQTVPVFYAAPMTGFSKGAIGHEKQKKPGVLGFVLLMVFLLVFIVGLVALGVVAG